MATDVVSVNDQLVDLYIERAIDLLRLEAGTRNKVLAILSDLENELVAAIAKVDPTGVDSVSAQTKRREKLLLSVRGAIRSSYRDASSLMTSEIREIADQESSWFASTVNSVTKIDFVTGGLTRGFLETIAGDTLIQGAASADWWSRQAQGLSNSFADAMRTGMALGETNADLITRVRGKPGTPGIMDISENSATRLVRSSVQAAANTAREEMYSKNDDLITSLQWHATLDTRTSIWCITRDGHHYSNTPEHAPKDGGPPWLMGPGAIHWNALAEGTPIKTARGQIPIESVLVGDLVLTHTGEWSTVSARRAKRLENGIVRVIHTESGRILRATDDHPIRLADGTWIFIGALEVGDYLLADPESMSEVSFVSSVVDAEPQNGPSASDQTQVSIHRTLKLVAPGVDFESDLERGYREIEHRCFEMILRNPTTIERDQSIQHHLFATAGILQKLGRNRLSDFLALFIGDNATFHACTHALPEASSLFGFHRLGDYVRSFARIATAHARRMSRIIGMGLLGQSPSPMRFAGWRDEPSGTSFEADLIALGSNGNSTNDRETGKNTIGQAVSALDSTERQSVLQVLDADKRFVVGGNFKHEQITSLDMSNVNINVYDLEVEGQSSYVANGIVVSNCRSTSIPVMKSWRDLGIDEDEVPQTTRASMDGQVPAKITFEGWLKKQGAERQDTVLGPTAADLWRRGKITFRDLLDQSGRPLTTEQLREKAARK